MKKILSFIFIILIHPYIATAKIDPTSIEKIKNAIVTIDTRVAVSAYQDPGSWGGTGFIVDKKQGLILTNNHVIGRASIGNYFVTFQNGRQSDAKLIYYDSWQDYAFLQVNIDEIPDSAVEITFAKDKPKLDQKVFIVGNNEGREFSFHDGYISGLYEIDGEMPQGSYIVNLNSAGGSSGSPLINDNNEAIGIIYGGSKTYSMALQGDYIKAALTQIQAGSIPVRRHIGIMTSPYSLDKAVKHKAFPKEMMEQYIKKFPNARNKIIAVYKVIAGSPAENILEAGDIIWEVSGVQIGPDLCLMDRLMDKASDAKVNITIYRNGRRIEQKLQLYDINDNKVEKIIEFAGALFFESDDLFSSKTGVPLKKPAIKNVQTGSPLSVIPVAFYQDYKNIYRLQILGINQYMINNLADLERNIPAIASEKFLNMKFKNYQPYYPHFSYQDNGFISAQEVLQVDVELDNINSNPRILKFDPIAHEWVGENIR
jgi:S1-C subfamily serine protease